MGFTSTVMAKEICTLTSEVESDVTITLKYTGSAGGIGTLNYKNKPSLGFYLGIWNGYGWQKLSKEMKTIIDASEGFFVDSGGCRKFFPYGWD